MAGITQGSGFRETQSGNQTSNSSSSAPTTLSATALKDAVTGIQNQSRNAFGGGNGGNTDALTKLLQQLIALINGGNGTGNTQGNGNTNGNNGNGGSTKPPSKPVNQPLTLTPQQDSAIRERFNIGGSLGYSVLDSKRDGKLSVGDTLVISGGITGGEISRQKLTQKDIKAINSGSSSSNTAQQQLDSNRQKWDSLGISDYSFTLQRSCFCTPDSTRPINIEVRGDKVTSATFADTGEAVSDQLDYNKLTVDDLFNQIGQSIKDGAAQVDVKYDSQYGIPTSIYIDQSQMMADEEVGYTVSNFQPEPMFTTLAVGEEDGGGWMPPTDTKPPLTTKMVGEEDGGIAPAPTKPPVDDPIMTTLALGEEDGGIHKGGFS